METIELNQEIRSAVRSVLALKMHDKSFDHETYLDKNYPIHDKRIIKKYGSLEELERQRDELLGTLQFALKAIKAVNSMGATKPIIERIEQAIKNATSNES